MADSTAIPVPTTLTADAALLRRRLMPILLTERIATWQRLERPLLLDVRDGRLLVTTGHGQLATTVPVRIDGDTSPRTVLATARELDELLRVAPESAEAGSVITIQCDATEWTMLLATAGDGRATAYDTLYETLRDRFSADGDAWPLVAAWALAAHGTAPEGEDTPQLRGVLLNAAEQLNNREWDAFRPELRRHVIAAGQLWATLPEDDQVALAQAALKRLEREGGFTRTDFDEFATLMLFERRGADVRDVPEPIRSRVAVAAALGLGVPSVDGPALLPSEHRRVHTLLASPVLSDLARQVGALPPSRLVWATALDATAAEDLGHLARREVRDFSPGFANKLSGCSIPALIAAIREPFGAGSTLTDAQRAVLTADDEAVVTALLVPGRWPAAHPPLSAEERAAVTQVLVRRLREPARDGLDDARATGEARRVGSARTARPTDTAAFLADATGASPPLGAAVPPARILVPVTTIDGWHVPPSIARRGEAESFQLEGEHPILPPPAVAMAALEAGVPLLMRPAGGEFLAHSPALTTVTSLSGTPSEVLCHFVGAKDHEVFAVEPEIVLAAAARARANTTTRVREEQQPDGSVVWEIRNADMTWRVGTAECDAARRVRTDAWRQEILKRAAVYEATRVAPDIAVGLHEGSEVFAGLRVIQADRAPLEAEHIEARRVPAAELSTLSIGKGNYLGVGRERLRDPDLATLSESQLSNVDHTQDRTLLVAPDTLADAIGLALVGGADSAPLRVRTLAGDHGDLELVVAPEGRRVSMLLPSPDRYDATVRALAPAMRAVIGVAATQSA